VITIVLFSKTNLGRINVIHSKMLSLATPIKSKGTSGVTDQVRSKGGVPSPKFFSAHTKSQVIIAKEEVQGQT